MPKRCPLPTRSFDAVVSTFGVMFTPNQDKAAAELMRVCKSGGKIGLANWTPDGFIGQLFKTLGKYLPPPAGVKSPGAVGNAGAYRRDVRNGSRRDPRRAAQLHVPLPVAPTLPRRVQDLLRPAVESVCWLATGSSSLTDERCVCADRAVQSVRRCVDGRSQ